MTVQAYAVATVEANVPDSSPALLSAMPGGSAPAVTAYVTPPIADSCSEYGNRFGCGARTPLVCQTGTCETRSEKLLEAVAFRAAPVAVTTKVDGTVHDQPGAGVPDSTPPELSVSPVGSAPPVTAYVTPFVATNGKLYATPAAVLASAPDGVTQTGTAATISENVLSA